MPIYVFSCDSCRKSPSHELLMSVQEYENTLKHVDNLPKCPKCSKGMSREWNTNTTFSITNGGAVGSKICAIKQKRAR